MTDNEKEMMCKILNSIKSMLDNLENQHDELLNLLRSVLTIDNEILAVQEFNDIKYKYINYKNRISDELIPVISKL